MANIWNKHLPESGGAARARDLGAALGAEPVCGVSVFEALGHPLALLCTGSSLVVSRRCPTPYILPNSSNANVVTFLIEGVLERRSPNSVQTTST